MLFETKYKPEYPQMLIDFMSQGYSYETFSAQIKVARSTIYEWENVHPEWKAAKQIAQASAQMFFEQRLIAKTAGVKIKGVEIKDIDNYLLGIALKHRFPRSYASKAELETVNKHQVSGAFTIVPFEQDDDESNQAI